MTPIIISAIIAFIALELILAAMDREYRRGRRDMMREMIAYSKQVRG